MGIRSLQAHTYPYDRTHDVYQDFYRRSLRQYCDQNGIRYEERSTARSESALRRLRKVRESYRLQQMVSPKITRAATDSIARLFSRDTLFSPDYVGTYELSFEDGSSARFAIDAMDSGNITASDTSPFLVYFKTNYWPTRTYPGNVLPAPNLNPMVGEDLDFFLNLRATPKRTDLFAFFRLWGGADEVEGVEHNLQLIESLAKIPCEKFVCAQLVSGDIASQAKRLESQGVQWTTKPMAKTDLWHRAAEARLNIVRLGMHECIPWRMTDILAMGGCPVIDYGPQTVWPHPLQEGIHLLNLNSAPGTAPASDLPARVSSWLSNTPLLQNIWHGTAEYFDQFLQPSRLGQELVETVVRLHHSKET